MDQNQNRTFQYTYSAGEQERIRAIRSKYMPRQESKLEQLHRLDDAVTQKATVCGLVAGVLGALIMGTGMSCCLVWAGKWFVPGIAIGLAGMALAAAAYPIYSRVLRKERERIAPQILQLTDELMK